MILDQSHGVAPDHADFVDYNVMSQYDISADEEDEEIDVSEQISLDSGDLVVSL